MDITHDQKHRSTRSNRRRVLEESARHLDAQWTARQAAANVNVDPARTKHNRLIVNDGSGGFVEAASVDEVLDYGDARLARLRRKTPDDAKLLTRTVLHLPKSMCHPEQWTTPTGQTRTRYVVDDPVEAARFFLKGVGHLADHLEGGVDGIHGFALNLDEMTPHIQILSDNLAPLPESRLQDDPQGLRLTYSQNWGQHRDVKDEQGRVIAGRRKLRQFQADLRATMVAAGFPVELDADPERSRRKLAKQDFVELAEQQEEVADDVRFALAARTGARRRFDKAVERERLADQREAQAAEEAARLETRHAALDEAFEAAEAARRAAVFQQGALEIAERRSRAAQRRDLDRVRQLLADVEAQVPELVQRLEQAEAAADPAGRPRWEQVAESIHEGSSRPLPPTNRTGDRGREGHDPQPGD